MTLGTVFCGFMTDPSGNKIFRKDCRILEMRSYGLLLL